MNEASYSVFFSFCEELVELLFVGVVVKISVEIGTSLHQRHHTFLRALPTNGFVDFERGGVHGSVGCAATRMISTPAAASSSRV